MLSGLREDQIVLFDEPSAAAYADIRENVLDNQTYLVFDVGAGTFDLSIVRIVKGNLQVLRRDGNSIIGGNDLTGEMMDLILDKYDKK